MVRWEEAMRLKMNIRCDNGSFFHETVENGQRKAVARQFEVNMAIDNSTPRPMNFEVARRCIHCDARGVFNQDGEAIRYLQPACYT